MNKLRFSKKNVSITFMLLISFVFISTIPVISTSIATYDKSKEIINSNTSQYIIQTLKQTNGEIELKLKQFNNDASFLVDPTVQKLMNQQVRKDLSFQEKKTLSERVVQYNVNSPKMSEVAVYSDRV